MTDYRTDVINLVPTVPPEPRAISYTLFSNRFFAPSEYSGWLDESVSWKETCYIGDWSPLLKCTIEGRDALTFLSRFVVNSFNRFEIGQAKHAVMCNSAGYLMGEGLLLRLEESKFLLSGSAAVRWMEFQFASGAAKGFDAKSTSLGSTRFISQVQGPTSLQTLEKATGERLRDIAFLRSRRVKIAGRPVDVIRQGMAGEIGYELQGATEDGAAVYEAVWQAGQEFGIRRLGERTKMVNHVEACFPTIGVDYLPDFFNAEQNDFLEWMNRTYPGATSIPLEGSYPYTNVREYCRTPVEMGWRKNINFDHEFIGDSAVKREVENPRRTMVTLLWDNSDVIDVYASYFRTGDPFEFMEMPRGPTYRIVADAVMRDGSLIGISTSRCYSYWFRQMLSLCVIDVAHAEPGTEVSVVWGARGRTGPQKEIRATVAPAPYKKDNRRANLDNMAGAAKPG